MSWFIDVPHASNCISCIHQIKVSHFSLLNQALVIMLSIKNFKFESCITHVLRHMTTWISCSNERALLYFGYKRCGELLLLLLLRIFTFTTHQLPLYSGFSVLFRKRNIWSARDREFAPLHISSEEGTHKWCIVPTSHIWIIFHSPHLPERSTNTLFSAVTLVVGDTIALKSSTSSCTMCSHVNMQSVSEIFIDINVYVKHVNMYILPSNRYFFIGSGFIWKK